MASTFKHKISHSDVKIKPLLTRKTFWFVGWTATMS